MPPTPGLPPPPAQSKRHPPTPITAGAFSFSLGPTSTPAKKFKTSSNASSSALHPPAGSPLRTASRASEYQTPNHDAVLNIVGTIPRPNVTSATPKKSLFQTLDSLPSPLAFRRRVDDDRPISSPGAGSSQQNKGSHRRLNDILDEASPFRPSATTVKIEGDGKRVRIGELPAQNMAGDVNRKRQIELKEEDEGVGVSPRKGKGIRWTGRGSPPPSLRFASLLSSTNSSLLLFYTSLQRTLHPPTDNPHRYPHRSAEVQTVITPSAIQHLRSAPIVLRLSESVQGRTHQCIIMWCEVLNWSTPSHATVATSSTDEESGDLNNVVQSAKPRRILVAFQPVPHECPRLGVDPRLAERKLSEVHTGPRVWEVGIWGPSSGVQLFYTHQEMQSLTEVNEGMNVEGEGEKKDQITTVVFASRYLIAEARQPEE